MAIDITSIISQLTNAAQKDASIVDKLDANPVALIEKLTGIDLPDEMLAPVLEGFNANMPGSLLSSEGLDIDQDGDVDLDDLKAGIMGSLL